MKRYLGLFLLLALGLGMMNAGAAYTDLYTSDMSWVTGKLSASSAPAGVVLGNINYPGNEFNMVKGAFGKEAADTSMTIKSTAAQEGGYLGLREVTGLTEGKQLRLGFQMAFDKLGTVKWVQATRSDRGFFEGGQFLLHVDAAGKMTFFQRAVLVEQLETRRWYDIQVVLTVGSADGSVKNKADVYINGIHVLQDYAFSGTNNGSSTVQMQDVRFIRITGANKSDETMYLDNVTYGIYEGDCPVAETALTHSDQQIRSWIDTEGQQLKKEASSLSVADFLRGAGASGAQVSVVDQKGAAVTGGTLADKWVKLKTSFGTEIFYPVLTEKTVYILRETFDGEIHNADKVYGTGWTTAYSKAGAGERKHYFWEPRYGLGGKAKTDPSLAVRTAGYTYADGNNDPFLQYNMPVMTGEFTVEASMLLDGGDADYVSLCTQINQSSANTRHLAKFQKDGTITVQGKAEAVGSWEQNRWYRVAATLHMGTPYASVYINGELAADHVNLGLTANTCGMFRFMAFYPKGGKEANGLFAVDDVKLYSGGYDNTKDAISLSSKSGAYGVSGAAISIPAAPCNAQDFAAQFQVTGSLAVYRGETLQTPAEGAMPVQDGDIAVITAADGLMFGYYRLRAPFFYQGCALRSAVMKDAEGNVLDGFKDASAVTLELQVNNMGDALEAELIAAAYDKEGRLLAIGLQPRTVENGVHTYALKTAVPEAARWISAFLWEGQRPVVGKAEFYKTAVRGGLETGVVFYGQDRIELAQLTQDTMVSAEAEAVNQSASERTICARAYLVESGTCALRQEITVRAAAGQARRLVFDPIWVKEGQAYKVVVFDGETLEKQNQNKIYTLGGEKPLTDPMEQWMHPIWEGNIAYQETVLLTDEGDGIPKARLLYDAKQILKVQNARQTVTYTEGVDYVFQGGTLQKLPGSRMYSVTKEEMYPAEAGSNTQPKKGGGYLLFGEVTFMTDKQVTVTYLHQDSYQGPLPAFAGDRLPLTYEKLKKGEDLTVVLSGDSISVGNNASSHSNVEPYMPNWGSLFAEGLQREFGASVRFYNNSKSGQTSAWGKENAQLNIGSRSPDLVLIGFGMNDASSKMNPQTYKENIRAMMSCALAANPKAEFILVSTILPNPEWTGAGDIPAYRAMLEELAEEETYRAVVADITQLHGFLLETKKYSDITGNNVNHLNDYLSRWYAQYLLKLFQA